MVCGISITEGTPDFTTLPVVKITEYPQAEGIYQPYAQGACCLNQRELCLRMLSFEAISIPGSTVLAAFGSAAGENLLVVRCQESGGAAFLKEGEKETPLQAHFHCFHGEDLQGKYWGVDVKIPREQLTEIFPDKSLQKGEKIVGNYYKICDQEPYQHRGSAAPCNFNQNDFLTREGMAEFVIADY